MPHNPDMIVFIALYDVAILAALGLLAVACITDFLTMTIPNGIPLGLVAAFAVAFAAGVPLGLPVFSALSAHLLTLGVMLALTFLMFVFRLWGAGDSKLAAAIALWLGPGGVMPFLLAMGLSGLGLVVLAVVLRRRRAAFSGLGAQSWPARLQTGASVLPYGIAIAIGAFWAFQTRGYLDFSALTISLR